MTVNAESRAKSSTHDPIDERRTRESWLVLRSQTGDREALDLLLRGVQDDLGRYITSLMTDSSDAPDVLQEVLLKIVRKVGTLRDPLLFRPWIFRIASREAFAKLRAEKEWQQLVDSDIDVDASPNPPSEESIAEDFDVARMIANVSLASRTVIALHYLEGLTHSEIAVALGLSIGTVKSRLAYGLTQLRKSTC